MENRIWIICRFSIRDEPPKHVADDVRRLTGRDPFQSDPGTFLPCKLPHLPIFPRITVPKNPAECKDVMGDLDVDCNIAAFPKCLCVSVKMVETASSIKG